MTPPKKATPKSTPQAAPTPAPQAQPAPAKETIDNLQPVKKAAGEISSEFHKVEDQIKKLPVDRRIVFFVGLAMIILAFLGVFGQWVTAILGVLVMYFSFTGKNPLDPNEGK